MKAHRFVRQVAQNELSEFESYPILETMAQSGHRHSHAEAA